MTSDLKKFLNSNKIDYLLLTEASESIGLGHLCRCENLKIDLAKRNKTSLIICFVDLKNNDNIQISRFKGVFFLPIFMKKNAILQLAHFKDPIFVFDFLSYCDETIIAINDLYKKSRTFIFDETHNYHFKNKTIINTSAGAEESINPSYDSSNNYILGLKYIVKNVYLNQFKKIETNDNQVLVVIGGTDHLGLSEKIYEKIAKNCKSLKFLFINPKFEIKMENCFKFEFLQKFEFYKILASSNMIISGAGQTLYEANYLRKKRFTIINSNIPKCELKSLIKQKIICEYGYPNDRKLFQKISKWLKSKENDLPILNPFFELEDNLIVDILVKTVK